MQKKKKPAAKSGQPFAIFRGHIWLDGSEGTFLGYGRVVLLERIREFGSITKAAKSMELSYRRAWVLIDSMNRQAPKPFVVTAAGGKGGGGTLVTEEGEKVIRLFWKLHNEFQKFLASQDQAVRKIFG
jgi:molybdate transport system regulatory protein